MTNVRRPTDIVDFSRDATGPVVIRGRQMPATFQDEDNRKLWLALISIYFKDYESVPEDELDKGFEELLNAAWAGRSMTQAGLDDDHYYASGVSHLDLCERAAGFDFTGRGLLTVADRLTLVPT